MNDDEIVLEECTDEGFAVFSDCEVEYPCVFIDGISSNDEVEFFRQRRYTDGASVPMYCQVQNALLSLGKFDLTLESLLDLRSIFRYRLTLYKSESNSVEIDLNDPVVLMKFIKL